MRRAIRAMWNEPAAPDPPPPGPRDWAISGVVVVLTLLEAALRSMPWKPVQMVFVLAAALAFPWRRIYPLAVTGSMFAAAVLIELATILGGTTSDGFYAGVFILVFPYSLLRWGSGRDVSLGLVFLPLFPWVGFVGGTVDFAESVAGTVFLLFPAAIGASVRYRSTSRARAIEQARLHEREQLARELHDTVAHHVSAIAIQAQAGRTVAAKDPGAAFRALDVIEEEASRTLVEMRAMVAMLRTGEAELAPQAGVAEIRSLADTSSMPRVEVRFSGVLDNLPSSVDAAVYRIAQESITNARRHARHAATVVVEVAGEDDSVRLTVRDDGDPAAPADDAIGFGIAGMAERARLLGGTFSAGPHAGRGWMVEAVVPRDEMTA